MARDLSARRVLEELQSIAFAQVTDYMQVEDGALVLCDSSRLSMAQRAAIASMEKATGGVKVKLYDKLKMCVWNK